MNKIYLTLLLILMGAAGVKAQSLDYLTLRTTDGAETSLPSAGLRLTFADGQLVARTTAGETRFDLAALDVMFFATQPTAISTLSQADAAPVYRDGALSLSGAAGTPVSLYAADGCLVSRFTKTVSGTERIAIPLPAGVYVVSANGLTTKFLAR